jgi:Mob1/phocein family
MDKLSSALKGESKGGSFREHKDPSGSAEQGRFALHRQLHSTLTAGDLKQIVGLPPGEDENEWLAVNTVDFYNQTTLLFGAISDFCSSETCPAMSVREQHLLSFRLSFFCFFFVFGGVVCSFGS